MTPASAYWLSAHGHRLTSSNACSSGPPPLPLAVSAECEFVGLHHTEPAMVFVRLDRAVSIYGTHERYGVLWDHRGLIASLGPVR